MSSFFKYFICFFVVFGFYLYSCESKDNQRYPKENIYLQSLKKHVDNIMLECSNASSATKEEVFFRMDYFVDQFWLTMEDFMNEMDSKPQVFLNIMDQLKEYISNALFENPNRIEYFVDYVKGLPNDELFIRFFQAVIAHCQVIVKKAHCTQSDKEMSSVVPLRTLVYYPLTENEEMILCEYEPKEPTGDINIDSTGNASGSIGFGFENKETGTEIDVTVDASRSSNGDYSEDLTLTGTIHY